MYANGQRIIQYFEEFAPKHLAMEGDKIGLQVGTLQKEVKKVMVALDVLEEVVDEAIAEGVDLIIAHHAVIFRPLKNLRTDLPAGRLYEKLIKHDIAVYVAHTNLDVAEGGINDLMAEALGLADVDILEKWHEQKLKKIVVYVPLSHADAVRDAMSQAGAGSIGQYSHCTFGVRGTGTFMPGEGADPYIGEQGKIEEVEEMRIETIMPEDIQARVVKAMIKAHPYEEVAYDIYPVEQAGAALGIGRIGKLKESVTLREFAEHVKVAFDVTGVRAVGNLDTVVQKVAVLGGDGNSFVSKAMFRGADVLVTGDIYYHTAHDAMAGGLSIIDPGHNVEKIMKQGVKNVLDKRIEQDKLDTKIVVSKVNTDPFTFL
ncbi:Nif3-like dinuclear metal center hexameric protein [Aneurinibacillus aneurinilyticus]|jgi:dinuclear metal center YbgI/SA1388 family protein|uniref:GTP cyclohydrolase 1 type 2 homolog n=2 Tax=Aneurinibacillus aneurinilyticus TaxID=1391 RepID=A0A848D4L5_ANEAE|nr:Nif3-like dinuclear metal center hexameric protein [Aneurinibacillus aneurinilyticus]ERI09897.1 dinuclear metal center protein, YbgI family [Aneurinibacillus aneurinilyticus ATCC 12856]MCI1695428.1 Nif3-like dinuclear metal center hexameric protein [Aneurinibacillus aneurinilyticus]MED0673248.1 Nif3-like dinuclear metal center hexameric protein [Aneurinibacillus aneurinilyticus]MED0706737.1 Nif3-like dinuclear metal center hexameric protein [Aneurinibacillus aneurinilyticus]MED0725700.1 Nif